MSTPQTNPASSVTPSSEEKPPMLHPAVWPYLILFVVLTAVWVLYVYLEWKPEHIVMQGGSPLYKFGWLVLPPLLASGTAFSLHDGIRAERHREWVKAQEAKAEQTRREREQALQAAGVEKAKRQFALEVLGLGLTVEGLRQTKVWQQIKDGPRFTYNLPEKDVKPSMLSDISGDRSDDARGYALDWLVEKWPIPTFLFGIKRNREFDPVARSTLRGTWFRFAYVDSEFGEMPTGLLGKVFDLFDHNTDIPVAAINGYDDIRTREGNRPKTTFPSLIPNLTYKHTAKHRTDTYVTFALGRKDRVDWLRPYATKAREDQLINGEYQGGDEDFTAGEWYEKEGWAAATPDAALIPFWDRPAKPFTPTKWIPKPWRTGQLHQIDALPVLGYLHRPVHVSYLLPEGAAMKVPAKQAAFAEGWKAALATLPDGVLPQLLFHNFGQSPMEDSPYNPKPHYKADDAIVPLSMAMQHYGPQELNPVTDAYNLPMLLGEMGAATPMAALAIAVMASHDEGKASAVVLFEEHGATIVMVSPPSPEERAKRHPAGFPPFMGKQNSSQKD